MQTLVSNAISLVKAKFSLFCLTYAQALIPSMIAMRLFRSTNSDSDPLSITTVTIIISLVLALSCYLTISKTYIIITAKEHYSFRKQLLFVRESFLRIFCYKVALVLIVLIIVTIAAVAPPTLVTSKSLGMGLLLLAFLLITLLIMPIAAFGDIAMILEKRSLPQAIKVSFTLARNKPKEVLKLCSIILALGFALFAIVALFASLEKATASNAILSSAITLLSLAPHIFFEMLCGTITLLFYLQHRDHNSQTNPPTKP